VVDDRVLFGCNDNRIYALKLQNGHRVWYQEMGQRILLPLVLWGGDLPIPKKKSGKTVSVPQFYDLILVVPHPGITLQVLDAFDGKSLASTTIGSSRNQFQGEFVTEPAVLDDGRIVIAVQKYKESEASLLVLGIVPTGSTDGDPEQMPYNGEGSRTGEIR
jgi:outer membrane protein assembly factor BamB